MKKILLTVAAIATFGFAQAQDIKFGVKGGLNFTNFTGDFNTDSKVGFYVGGLADFTVTEKFHVQPELLYSAEGADNDAAISYLRIPVMAKYYVADGFNIQAGPEVAFKVAADDGVDNATKSLDFGLGLGAGYEMESGLMFDARYNFGLANIYDGDNYDLKNVGFQIGVGYRF
ncbi:PorT family protein [Flavobacterium sp. NRK F10]|uniref:Outer membrane protein beta-barrel domain-containing protein n=1 Tax=Flavobacterium sediminis TaxID=2201181 RepID=A0A2U8QRT2_9FLAO|nr:MULTISPECIES: porin family protein [Flavobacterium]AWM12867.1 hypothetical protein DI487_02610 [Flavobacterium sediminis]MCO6174002.1 PorT family protein [Flavobacterium sp. NRK F10]